ncbi:MAG: HAMP domain-containing protein [Chloroflexi bacterium]|nr:MAG: HAMP domain-containing protein [Chloroflexota bacterium]
MSNHQPKKRFAFSRFNIQIILIAILPLSVLLLAITFGSLTLHQQAMRSLVGERDQRTALSTANALQQQLDHRASAIQNLALRARDGTSPTEILNSVQFLKPDFDQGLAFFDADGNLTAATTDINRWESALQFGESSIKSLFNTVEGFPTFSPAFETPDGLDYLVFLGTTVPPDGKIVVGAFSINALAQQTVAEAITNTGEASAYMVDDAGHILYRIGDLPIIEPALSHPGVQEALLGNSGTSYLSVEGGEHVVAYNPVTPTGWALVIEESWESVASPLLRYTEGGSLILVPVVLLALAAVWFSARRIVEPLQNLETRAAALAWGDFDAVETPVGGIEEIGRLQHTLVHMSHKVKSAQQGLRDYIGAITEGQEDERRRLARELHDDTIQSLIALNQRVQLASRALENSEAVQSLTEIKNLVDQIIQDLRRLTRALRPLYLDDLGLVTSLDMLARETSEVAGFPIHFVSAGTEYRLSPQVEMALYRIAQEGVSNISRHANATQGSLALTFDPDGVTLTINDNGEGFNVPESPAEFTPRGHFGLVGIHERAELIGAQLSIHSSSQGGTTITVSLPNPIKASSNHALSLLDPS